MQEHSMPEMRKWKCKFCGYIYDEARGIPEDGIAPGTRFEDLPADWCCPNCDAEKHEFRLMA
jgi:rubredoxin-NAD+ reductase